MVLEAFLTPSLVSCMETINILKQLLLLADPCFYNGTCTNTDGSYKCSCTSDKTGKKCELEKAACEGNPCNGTDICALSERSSRGFQCVNKQLETVMTLPEGLKYSSVYDLENKIENLIKTAPNNANMVRCTSF